MAGTIEETRQAIPDRFSIALDGPAAAGKSTVAALVADRLGAVVFDTGVLYRAVTLAALEDGVPADDAARLAELASGLDVSVRPPSVSDGRLLDVVFRGRDVTWELRSVEVDSILSQIAALPEVRKSLLEPQRRIGHSGKVIIVGRDIGTVVMPDADLKVYLEASTGERARRRYTEMLGTEHEQPFEDVLAALTRRDRLDSERATSPLRPASDALVIQSDNLPAERVADEVVAAFYRAVVPQHGRAKPRSQS